MTKDPRWRQDTPAQQIVVCLQSAWGHIENITDDRCRDTKKAKETIDKNLEEIQELAKWIEKYGNTWEAV